MNQLWSPWRSQYIDSFSDTQKKSSGCFLCDALQHPNEDKERFVVARKQTCFIIMNRYPYNSGHILVVPNTHIGTMAALSEEQYTELMQTVREASVILTKVFSPDGINVGANLGQSAGAGVPDHLHFHLVPRWNGDTNFMSTLADVKVISSSMEDTWEKLTAAFASGR